MAILFRIVDKNTLEFLRDDFTFDNKIELAFDIEPAQGLLKPKLDINEIDGQTVYTWVESK